MCAGSSDVCSSECSVLVFGIIAPGRAGHQVIAECLELAALLDRLGYHRLWLSEHHETHFCWTSPEVMAAALAQRTRRLRIGTAAVLIAVRNPLLVRSEETRLNSSP